MDRLRRACALASILPLATMANPATAAPLAPSGKWNVQYRDGMCLLERSYGTAPKDTVLAIKPASLGAGVEIRFNEALGDYVSRTEDGVLRLSASKAVAVKVGSYGPVEGGRRVTSLFDKTLWSNDLIDADVLTLERGKAGAPISLALGGSNKVRAALQTCQDDLVRRWGIDPVALHAITRAPTPDGSPLHWFKGSDYPKAARKNARGGVARARLTVAADGRVEDCGVIESAGNPDLDAKTCEILTSRGRFIPGLGADGQPARAWTTLGVVWLAFKFGGVPTAMAPVFIPR